MAQSRTLSVGMDGQKASSAIAAVAQAHGAEVVSLGTIGPRQGDSAQLLRQRHAKAHHLVLVSDASPCGSWLYRSLTQKDDGCWVGAPSLMPHKAGDRVNTDRRDAMPLARLMRSGDRTPVSVPARDDAAIRALRRAREETLRALTAAQLRHDLRSTGRATWRPAPRRWLSAGGCPTPAPQIVLQPYVQTVTEQTKRRGRRALARHEQGNPWRFAPGVEARQALRGGPCTGAVTTGAELGDLTRFAPPRQRMHALELTPSA